MTRWAEAADWSRFQPAHSEADLRRLQAAGVELVIPGSWHGDALGRNPNCRGDLERARRVGLRTATYTVLDSPAGTTARGAVRRARDICGNEWQQLSFVSLDIEVAGVTIPEIRAAIDEVRRLDQRPIIYTAYWFWHDVFGNPRDAAICEVPLWNAYYDSDDDIDFGRLPYGCWRVEDVVGEQYEGTTRLAGLEVDRNTFDMDWVEAWPEKGDEAMTDEERREFNELKAKVARIGALQRAGGIFATVAGKALQGEDAGEDADQARALLGP